MPGGVNSPVRSFRSVGGVPRFIASAKGSTLTDADGNQFIDFISSWGAVIHGHADPAIEQAVSGAASNGTSFGACHEGEVQLAELVTSRVPGLEMVRFVNSGTEAAIAGIRLVRAATGRTKIVKFEGNYHGAVDSLLATAGSGVATFGLPDSAGVPSAVTQGTLVAQFNNLGSVEEIIQANPNEIAAIFLEPVSGNMGLIPPAPSFLEGVRKLATEHGILLVFDEVMTGFRVAQGGAQERYRVQADVVLMGKVIGGGLPVGAYGASRAVMSQVAPLGPMYQAGTLSGNPLAMAAGYAAVSNLTKASYQQLEDRGHQLESGLREISIRRDVPMQVQRVGSMISVFFAESPVLDYRMAQASNKDLFNKMFNYLLNRGIMLPPSALEAWFMNLSHTSEQVSEMLDRFDEGLKQIKND